MKRILYFGYYLKNLDLKVFAEQVSFAKQASNKNTISLTFDSVLSSFKYNISLHDYFLFRFFEKNKEDRGTWAGTGFMYEYQLKMNPSNSRDVLSDKIKFLQEYDEFIDRAWVSINNFNQNTVENILKSSSGKLAVKHSKGQAGQEVEILDSKDFDFNNLHQYMKDKGFDLLEEGVVQHHKLMELSPSGLNTLRLITQINNNNEVDLLAARLRVSVLKGLDNFHQGGFVVALDPITGKVISNGVYRDITKNEISIHPITKTALIGFQVPNWDLVIEITKKAALKDSRNKSIGWDIAVTESSAEIIEANHNWNHDIYQLPVKKGMKNQLKKHL